MLRGDWGFSFVSRVNVVTLILQRLPTTLFVLGSRPDPGPARRAADRHLLGGAAVLVLRPGHDHARLRRLLAAHVLHRPPLHPAASASTSTGCRSSTARTSRARASPGCGRTSRQAIMPIAVLGLAPGRLDDALRALRRPRGDPARLHQHRARQGPLRAGHHHQARGAERADPGGDADRAPDPRHLHRRRDHRADLPGARASARCSSARSSPTTRR